eukprot:gene14233-30283_t
MRKQLILLLIVVSFLPVFSRYSTLLTTQLATLKVQERKSKSTKKISKTVDLTKASNGTVVNSSSAPGLKDLTPQAIPQSPQIPVDIYFQVGIAALSFLVPAILSRIDTKIKTYDLLEVDKFANSLLMEILFITYLHIYKKTIPPLFIIPFTGFLNKIRSPLIRIYLFGERAVGLLQRPFKSSMEVFIDSMKDNVQPKQDKVDVEDEVESPAPNLVIDNEDASDKASPTKLETEVEVEEKNLVLDNESETEVEVENESDDELDDDILEMLGDSFEDSIKDTGDVEVEDSIVDSSTIDITSTNSTNVTVKDLVTTSTENI